MNAKTLLSMLILCMAVCFAATGCATVPATAQGKTHIKRQVDGFHVRISLSPMARTQMQESKETLKVFGDLFGWPKPGFRTHTGEVGLSHLQDQEVGINQEAAFGPSTFDEAALATTKGEPQVLINVVSGRKSSPNNLLDCDIYEGPLAPVMNKTIFITCSLPEERRSIVDRAKRGL